MSKKDKIIASLWGSYKEKVLPKGAPPVQVIESRRAFYAGSMSLIAELMRHPEEDDFLETLDSVRKEMEEFVENVTNGVA